MDLPRRLEKMGRRELACEATAAGGQQEDAGRAAADEERREGQRRRGWRQVFLRVSGRKESKGK